MAHRFAAEWLKLTRRPLVWVLLALFLGLLVTQTLAQFAFVTMIGARDSSPAVAAQVDEWRKRIAFPGVFGAVFNHVNGLGGIFAIVLAAAAMGSEYSWGTLRPQIARRPERTQFVLAKLLILMALLALATLLALGVGALLAALLGALAGSPGTLTAGDLVAIGLALVRAVYVLLPYVLLTLYITIAARSLVAGLVGGLLYLVFEVGLGALTLFDVLGGVWRQIYNLTIGQNINTLALQNSHAFGLRPEQLTALDVSTLPPAPQAVFVVALYCALFVAAAVQSLRERDIFGPA